MDMEKEELQLLGFIGIFKESLKIILKWPKIFTKITLAFILPLSCYSLANNGISMLFLDNNKTQVPVNAFSPTYNNIYTTPNLSSSKLAIYWLINVAYLIFSSVLSLFSISAVVYTIACIYTSKDFTFKKVISVVPKVWKRLAITFLCKFSIIFGFTFAFFLVLFIGAMIMFSAINNNKPGGNLQVGMIIAIILVIIATILFLVGAIYVVIVWQLANVISIMEKNCGFQALRKSKELIKGKMGTSIAIILVLSLCGLPLFPLINQSTAAGVAVGKRVFCGFISVVVMTLFSLFGLVVQTVLYFVCKSYHHENIDKSLLADHLEVYHGDYVPLKTEDIQIERLWV